MKPPPSKPLLAPRRSRRAIRNLNLNQSSTPGSGCRASNVLQNMTITQAVFRIACIVLILSGFAIAEDDKPRELSPAAIETLRILEVEEFKSINVDPTNLDETFEKIKQRLEQKGVKVRLKKSQRREKPTGELKLVNIPMITFMKYFDQWAGWGWIVYDDGSITYFDAQCGCSWPKAGVSYHEEQYQAGKPENMEKDAKVEVNKELKKK